MNVNLLKSTNEECFYIVYYSISFSSWQPTTENKSYLIHNSGKVYEFVDYTIYEEDIEIITPSKKIYCFDWTAIDTIVYREERIIKM